MKTLYYLISILVLTACGSEGDWVHVKYKVGPDNRSRTNLADSFFGQRRSYAFTDTACQPKLFAYVKTAAEGFLQVVPVPYEFNSVVFDGQVQGDLFGNPVTVDMLVSKGPSRFFGIFGAFSQRFDCSDTVSLNGFSHMIHSTSGMIDVNGPLELSGRILFHGESLTVHSEGAVTLGDPISGTRFGEIKMVADNGCGIFNYLELREVHSGMRIVTDDLGTSVAANQAAFLAPIAGPLEYEVSFFCNDDLVVPYKSVFRQIRAGLNVDKPGPNTFDFNILP